MSEPVDTAALLAELQSARAAHSEVAIQAARQQYNDALDSGADACEEGLELAKLLVASPNHRDIQQGIDELNRLMMRTFKPSECALLIASGYYNRGEYKEARKVLSQLMLSDPSNEKAVVMLELVGKTVWKDGPKFAAIAVLGIAVVTLGYWWLRKPGDDVKPITRPYQSNYRSSSSSSTRRSSSGSYYR